MTPETIGRYLIKEELGRGGMATVFRAVDPRFKRDVAIKVLPRQFLHDPTFRARFEREAQTIAALEHPAIVPVYDFGEDDEQPYLVMRLMSGGTLAERLHMGPLPLARIATLLGWLAPALDEAHRQGIIHRDLKPSNILFDQWDKPYLSDFGIVKLVEGSGGTLTDTSTALGTPAYMSPEQVLGEGKLDSRSDIYAFGVILFEMLTGKKPYVADTPMGQALKHVTDTIPHVQKFNPSLPPECQVIIARAMAKDRAKRYQTATELAAAILPIAGITPSSELLYWSEVKTPTPTPVDYAPDEATASVSGSESQVSSSESEVSSFKSQVSSDQSPVSSLSVSQSPPPPTPASEPTRIIGRGVKPVAILPPDPARVNTPTPRFAAAPATTASTPSRRLPTWALLGGGLLLVLIIAGLLFLREADTDAETTPTQSAALLPPPTLRFTLEPGTTPTLNSTPSVSTPTDEPRVTPTSRPRITLPTTPISLANVAQVNEITYWGQGIPNEVAFSPQGDRLALATTAGLFVYAIEAGQVQSEPLLAIDPQTVINTLAYSPDGTLIATGDTDRTVQLWDAATGERLQVLEGHENWIRTVAFSPDGTTLASGSSDTAVRLWPINNGVAGESQELLGFNTTVWGVAFAPDNQTLAVALNDNTIQLLEVANPDNRRTFEGHTGRVFAVTFSADGSRLASASADGVARLWDVASGETLTLFEGHVGWLRSVSLTPDGERLVTASYDSTARLWNVADGTTTATLFGHLGLVVHSAISPDGNLIATVSADGSVRLWQGDDGTALGILADGTGRVLAMAVDGTGEFAAAGTYDGSVRLWRIETGEPVHFLTGHQNWVRAVAFSPDGALLASGSDDRTVRLWTVETGELYAQLTGHTSRIRWLSFSPTGDRLFVGTGDGSAWVWRLGAGEPTGVEVLPAQPESALTIAFSPDGSLIATGTELGQVRLWRASDGGLVHDLPGHAEPVNALSFSPDGTLLVSASTDGTARLWQISDGQTRTVWSAPGELIPLTGLIFAAEGQMLVLGSEQGHIWWVDIGSNQTLQTQQEHSDLVRGLAFTPTRNLLFSGSDDGTVVLWGIP
jgi:WD40 repeat protein